MRRIVGGLTEAERHRQQTQACAQLARVQSQAPLLYMALPDELDLGFWMRTRWTNGQAVYLPRVAGDDIEVVRVRGPEELQAGAYGILEPREDLEVVELQDLDLVVTPGRAFDTRGGRMGRGAGFYDRFLKHRSVDQKVVGVCFTQQLVPEVPMGPHDVPVDDVLTAEGWACRR